jgi:hypothetical protein
MHVLRGFIVFLLLLLKQFKYKIIIGFQQNKTACRGVFVVSKWLLDPSAQVWQGLQTQVSWVWHVGLAWFQQLGLATMSYLGCLGLATTPDPSAVARPNYLGLTTKLNSWRLDLAIIPNSRQLSLWQPRQT